MTQADRLLSTPPTNTSALPVDPSRRHLLAIATGGGVAAAVLGAAFGNETEPIFAAIERHRELSAAYTAAVDISAIAAGLA